MPEEDSEESLPGTRTDPYEEPRVDVAGLNANIAFRDDFIRPVILFLLVSIGFGSLIFTCIWIYGIVAPIGWGHGTNIAYTTVMGMLTLAYLALHTAYWAGIIGYPTEDQLPYELYRKTRRDDQYWYISPGRYYDDRVPSNIVGVNLMACTVPLIVTLSIIVMWRGDSGRHHALTKSVGTVMVTVCSLFVVSLQLLLMTTIALHRYAIYDRWDMIPKKVVPSRITGN